MDTTLRFAIAVVTSTLLCAPGSGAAAPGDPTPAAGATAGAVGASAPARGTAAVQAPGAAPAPGGPTDPAAAKGDAPSTEYPRVALGQSPRGLLVALIDRNRSLTLELLGKAVAVDPDAQSGVIRIDGRPFRLGYDDASQFSTPGAPDLLGEHMKWRFDAEWAQLLSVADLSRRIRSGEQIDETSKRSSFAPVNVKRGVVATDVPVLGWEVDLQKATGVFVKGDTPARRVYRTIAVDSGVFVVDTVVLTSETAKADEVRRILDARLATVALHGGPLDFARYATAHGWTPFDPEAAQPPSIDEVRELCAQGQMRACGDLGGRYLFGKGGVATDLDKAKVFLEKGCEGDDAQSCFGLAVMYANGKGFDADKGAAVRFLARACELGLEQGCKMREQMAAEMRQKKY